MCSGSHSAEKSFACLSWFCILCCPFEVLLKNFHRKDSDQSYSKETPLSLFHSASPNVILLWRILCATSIDLLKNVFGKHCLKTLNWTSFTKHFNVSITVFMKNDSPGRTEWHLNVTPVSPEDWSQNPGRRDRGNQQSTLAWDFRGNSWRS